LAPEALRKAFDASLAKLKLDYVDMYMVHWPSADMDMAVTMEALIKLREAGRTRAIGVCNFNLPMVRKAVDEIGAPIAALQVEYHPFLDQSTMLSYLRPKGIPLTAYAPLAQGRATKDETLQKIGGKYGASAAQVTIAWLRASCSLRSRRTGAPRALSKCWLHLPRLERWIASSRGVLRTSIRERLLVSRARKGWIYPTCQGGREVQLE
jgi:diketogulonate reductase-like aldo/keto reductase